MDVKVFILEHNPFAKHLQLHLQQWGYQIAGLSDNGAMALDDITTQRPDLILMAININGSYNGIQVADKIQSYHIPIIFMSEIKDEIIYEKAQNTSSIQYLVKPFDMLTLKSTIEHHFKRQSSLEANDNEELFVRKSKRLVRINAAKIDWIQTSRNNCIISSEGSKFVVRKSMKEILLILPKGKFIKIHKSYSVRLKAVTGILLSESKVVVGDDMLPMGRNYRKKFLNSIRHIP